MTIIYKALPAYGEIEKRHFLNQQDITFVFFIRPGKHVHRGPVRGFPQRFHGRELGGLLLGHQHAVHISEDENNQGKDEAESQPGAEGFEKKFPTLGSYLRWGDGECDKFWMIDRYNDMCYTDGISAIDVFGKFENIEQSLFDVLRVCSISTKGKKTYSGYIKDEIKARGNDERRIAEMFNVSHHDHYSSYYYDEELIELVRQRERPLIESFRYSFETSCNRIYPYD